jgi:hypothetical protein
MSAARKRGLTCGGAVEVARSYLQVHVKSRWTGTCRGCRDHYPCPERRDAEALLGVPPKRLPGIASLALQLLCLAAAVWLALLP